MARGSEFPTHLQTGKMQKRRTGIRLESLLEIIQQKKNYSDSPDNSSQEIDANFLGTRNLTSSAPSLIMDKEIKDLMFYYRDLQSQIKDDLVSHRNESIKKSRELCPKLFEFFVYSLCFRTSEKVTIPKSNG